MAIQELRTAPDNELVVNAIHDQTGEVMCLECFDEGQLETFKMAHVHFTRAHDITTEQYRARHGDVPVVSQSLLNERGPFEYAWNLLPVSSSTLNANRDFLHELEGSRFMAGDEIFQTLAEFYPEGSTGNRSFEELACACVLIATQEYVPSIRAKEIGERFDVDPNRIIRCKKDLGDTQLTPEDKVYSRLEDVKGALEKAEYEEAKDLLNEMGHIKYNRSPSIVISYIVWTVSDRTKKAAAWLLDVTPLGLRHFQQDVEG